MRRQRSRRECFAHFVRSLRPFDDHTFYLHPQSSTQRLPLSHFTVMKFNAQETVFGISTASGATQFALFDYKRFFSEYYTKNDASWMSNYPCIIQNTKGSVQEFSWVGPDELLFTYNGSPRVDLVKIADDTALKLERRWLARRNKELGSQGSTCSYVSSKRQRMLYRGSVDGGVSVYDMRSPKMVPALEFTIPRKQSYGMKPFATQILCDHERESVFHCSTSAG